jgi:hypothetical protein
MKSILHFKSYSVNILILLFLTRIIRIYKKCHILCMFKRNEGLGTNEGAWTSDMDE